MALYFEQKFQEKRTPSDFFWRFLPTG